MKDSNRSDAERAKYFNEIFGSKEPKEDEEYGEGFDISLKEFVKDVLPEDKVKAAKQIIEKCKPAIEEFRNAAEKILKSSQMRPVYNKLLEIQEKYNKKIELMRPVKETSKKVGKQIDATLKEEYIKIEKFEKKHQSDIQSEDLEGAVLFRNSIAAGKVLFGRLSVRLAKTPYTLAARYQALKGDTKKQNQMLMKGSMAARRVIKNIQAENRRYAKETGKRIKTFNAVDDYTTHYKEREDRVEEIDRKNTEYYEATKTADPKKRSICRAAINKVNSRTYRGNKLAETIENLGNGLARTSAIIGQHRLAEIVAEKTISVSDDVIKKVAQKNVETLTKADPNRKQTTKERLGAIAQNLGGDIWETAQIARREFKFREKRAVNAKKARTIFSEAGKEIGEEFSESWKETRDVFKDLVSEMESKRAESKMQRKYTREKAESKPLVLLKTNARRVNDLIRPQLLRVQNVAAQIDIAMNPEKNRRKNNKEKESGDRTHE